jgi:hypothetical protein
MNSDLFGLDQLDLYTCALDLQNQFSQMSHSYRRTFFTFLEDELQPMDDDFDILVHSIVETFRLRKNIEPVIDSLLHSYSLDSIKMVLQAIQDYLADSQYD